MEKQRFDTGDAFYLAAGRGLAATFLTKFADQFEQAYRVFGNRDEGVQATLLNTVPQDVLDEVRNVFDDLAYSFTRRLAEMSGETDDGDDDPVTPARCCGGHCDSEHAPIEIAGIFGVDELRPTPAEAAGE